MIITIKKAKGLARCRNPDCRKKPAFINGKDKIIKGTICAVIIVPQICILHYCRDCIDLLYEEAKKKLNSALWVFH